MAPVGIKNVAQKAGVSTATVSHTLRNPSRVAEATRKKVLAAIKETGYTPNNLGVSLRTSRSKNIVVIIPDITNSHYSDIITAIEKVASDQGYSVLLGNSGRSPRREQEFAQLVVSRQADGILLFSRELPFSEEVLKDHSLLPPIVNGCEPVACASVPSVGIDDVKAGFDAAQHLMDYGHTDIAIITGEIDSPSSRNRLTGFKQAIESRGLAISKSRIVLSEYSLQGGEQGAKQLLAVADRPSAICCFSDAIALGAMATLRKHGLSVPDDISIIGFDGIEFGSYSSPALTTIAQPATQIGKTCMQILLQLLNGEPINNSRVILPHSLLIRGSTRRLNTSP